jgi:hypothetical protein
MEKALRSGTFASFSIKQETKMLKKMTLISALLVSFAVADEKGKIEEKREHGGEAVAGHVEHAHAIKAPNGGRILHEIVPHAEFFITKDRKVEITFVDDEGKALKDAATVRAIGGKRTAPTKFTFKNPRPDSSLKKSCRMETRSLSF